MDSIYEHALLDASSLEVHAEKAAPAEFQGYPALRLENGLVLLPGILYKDLSLEVWIAAEKACYPGLAFRAKDEKNYELAYTQPHTSGGWDALQYDPVFNQSNTWQAYHGPCYQRYALVPTGSWFKLRVNVYGERAAICVDNQPALVVEQLAYGSREGQLGLWTYLPAYFRGLRLFPCTGIADQGEKPGLPANAVTKWDLDGTGEVTVEPNGTLNLNRYLPVARGAAYLAHRFSIPEPRQVEFAFGFSDELTLKVDRQEIFHGVNKWQGMQSDYSTRGYIIPGQHHAATNLAAGEHELTAELAVNEPFGWGIALSIND